MFAARPSRLLTYALPCTLLIAACSGDASMPGGPSAPSATGAGLPAAAAATISGTAKLAGSGSSGGKLRTLAPSALVVRVAGTTIQARADGSGHFTLEGVPPGDVQLVFEGSGINATLTLSGIQSEQTVTIVVVLKGNSAVLEGEDDDSADDNGSVDDDESADDDGSVDDDDSADDDEAEDHDSGDDHEDSHSGTGSGSGDSKKK